MPRPKVNHARREDILIAFERCVVLYGLEGATLAHLSEESGLARPLIRHHAGNRDDLIDALIARFMRQSVASVNQLERALPPRNSQDCDRIPALLSRLFDEDEPYLHTAAVARALMMAARDNTVLAEKLSSWLDGLTGFIKLELENEHPEVDKADLAVAAAGISTLFLGSESFIRLPRAGEFIPDARRAAEILYRSTVSISD